MNGNDLNTPLVSIIMNCYNGEKYLMEAINSVLKQTYTNWELIFWDNQSTDSSAELFKSMNDKRFKYYYAPKHTSLGEARNLAVKKANGTWIGFLDCDDLWVHDKLANQVDIIRETKNNNLGLVFGKVINFSDEGVKYNMLTIKNLPEGNIFDKLAKDNFIPISSAIVNKDKYWAVGGVESSFKQAEDYDLFIKLSYSYEARVVNEVVSKYRLHPNNLSAFQKDLAYIESINILERYLPDKRAKAGLRFWSSLFFLFSIKHLKITREAVIYFYRYGSILKLFKLLIRFVNEYKN